MAFHHRKLLNETVEMTKNLCETICDAPTNPDRVCPLICDGFCPPYCKLINFQLGLPPPPPPPLVWIPKAHSVHTTLSIGLTISLAVLATAFFLFICYTIYRFYSYWRNSRRRPSQRRRPEEDSGLDDFVDEEHGPIVDHHIWYIRTIGLQPSVISAITVVKYKRGDGLIEGTDCAVCLNEFEEDETLRLLPKCNHAFHIPCVDTWLRSHTNCPMCRAGIVINTAAPLPVQNSGPVEENQSEISETEPSELRLGPGIEGDGISRSQSGLKINGDAGEFDGVQPMRRSVSMDSLSASMISAAIASAFPQQSNRNSDNQSGCILRAGTCSIKRSVSCGCKVLGIEA
ncbi:hypothetical protein ACS0TY_011639 [Phlomoides rotata]